MGVRRLRMSTIVSGVLAAALAGLWPAPAGAQTPFVPYFGKNEIRFFKFEWKVYKTEHFEIYYYPSIEPHLERVAGYAENAYIHISGELKHDLPERIPLILFKTQSEFQTNNVFVGVPEGVLAFAEPERHRMVLPIDEPPDQLYRLITHELTHEFEFDIIPHGLLGSSLPLWMDEGLANYMAGYWNIIDLMQIREAALVRQCAAHEPLRVAADVGPAALFHGPCRLRVHGRQMGQGRPEPVPVLAAQERRRRRRKRVQGSAQGRT